MGKYGVVALRATELIHQRACGSPQEAWALAAGEAFPGSLASRKKGCPKSAYLGLCEAGLVARIPRGSYTGSRDNKAYAIDAVRLLQRDPALADASSRDGGAMKLWTLVMRGSVKRPNAQMDVVLALWNRGLIVSPS